MEDDDKKKKTSPSGATTPITTETGGSDNLKSMSLEELNTLLSEVLEQEDYIRAIAIRDEIAARK
jgi:protein-arginine kinase activator protein McsA